MNHEEFINYIESIGFKYDGYGYLCKEYIILLYYDTYGFCNGSEWFHDIDYDDLKLLKKFERSYKLKELLK